MILKITEGAVDWQWLTVTRTANRLDRYYLQRQS